MNKITHISPLSAEEKIKFTVGLIDLMDRTDFKYYMSSRKVAGRTAIYNGFTVNWTTYWHLPDDQKQIYVNKQVADKKVFSAELLTKVDFEDLLYFYCTRYSLNRLQNLIDVLDFPVEISFSMTTTIKESKDDLAKVVNQPLIQFSGASN